MSGCNYCPFRDGVHHPGCCVLSATVSPETELDLLKQLETAVRDVMLAENKLADATQTELDELRGNLALKMDDLFSALDSLDAMRATRGSNG